MNNATSSQDRPAEHPVMVMGWSSLLFIHWPVSAERLSRVLPPGLTLDTFDGKAWVGLVPFTMNRVGPPWLPRWLRAPGVTDFHECNVRTYVTVNGVPGVFFFSLDAASPLAVWGARTFWQLPYYNARIKLRRIGGKVDYRVDRRDGAPASMACRWTVGDPLPQSRPGELLHFLTERYALFSHRDEQVQIGRIWHPPWPLRAAELLALDDTLVAAAGIDGREGEPIVHAADPVFVKAWPIEPVGT